jgi:hypothetical protein
MSEAKPPRGAAKARLMGLQTLLGTRPAQGVFLPYRYAVALPDPAALPPYPAVAARFAAAAPAFEAVFGLLERHAAALAAIGAEATPPQPRWRQSWFPRLDAAVAYVVVRDRAPRKIVEIGAGHSTRFLARAVADGGLATRIESVDPAPRADLHDLPVTLHRRVLQEVDPALFADLAPGDLVSIDSSHLLLPGSDVDLFVSRILPALPAGVLVHVHDILLPDPYPAAWTWRGYGEQQAWAPLLGLGAVKPLWSSRWATTRLAERVAASPAAQLPLPEGALETSLWVETL